MCASSCRIRLSFCAQKQQACKRKNERNCSRVCVKLKEWEKVKPKMCVRLLGFFSDHKSQRAIHIRHQYRFGRFRFFFFSSDIDRTTSAAACWTIKISWNSCKIVTEIDFARMNGFNEHVVTVSDLLWAINGLYAIKSIIFRILSRHWNRLIICLSTIPNTACSLVEKKGRKLTTACDFSLSNSHDGQR